MIQRRAKKKSKFLVCMFTVIILLISYMKPTFGQEGDSRNILTPTDTEFLEMRATKINEMPDKTKQVIMELYANDLTFKRIRCQIFI